MGFRMVGGVRERVVVFTGAGVSAESGLKTFRDAGGLWEGYRVEEVATPEAFERDPELVLSFYNERRRKVLAAQPNEAHLAIARLEEKFDVVVITQNIDDLHERAGSKRVIHIHGEILKARCLGPCQHVLEWRGDIRLEDRCPGGYRLRPHVVWFGEPVLHWEEAEGAVREADRVLIVGTSLVVYPAAMLPFLAPEDSEKVVVDPGEPSLPGGVDVVHIRERATVGVPQVVEAWLAGRSVNFG